MYIKQSTVKNLNWFTFLEKTPPVNFQVARRSPFHQEEFGGNSWIYFTQELNRVHSYALEEFPKCSWAYLPERIK